MTEKHHGVVSDAGSVFVCESSSMRSNTDREGQGALRVGAFTAESVATSQCHSVNCNQISLRRKNHGVMGPS